MRLFKNTNLKDINILDTGAINKKIKRQKNKEDESSNKKLSLEKKILILKQSVEVLENEIIQLKENSSTNEIVEEIQSLDNLYKGHKKKWHITWAVLIITSISLSLGIGYISECRHNREVELQRDERSKYLEIECRELLEEIRSYDEKISEVE